jgi:hypothetical protein
MRITLASLAAVLLVLAGCSGTQCESKVLGTHFCVPDSGYVQVGQTLSFEVVDTCGAGCGSTLGGCQVTRDGGSIVIGVSANICPPPPNVACTLACAITRFNCTIPALGPGTYSISTPGAVSPTRVIEAIDGGGDSSCVVVGVP